MFAVQIVLRSAPDRLSNGRMKDPQNIVKLRVDGFPLDALDQKRMRLLRRTSDRMGVPIPDLIRQILAQMIGALLAEAELPNKIVKFSAGHGSARVSSPRCPAYSCSDGETNALMATMPG